MGNISRATPLKYEHSLGREQLKNMRHNVGCNMSDICDWDTKLEIHTRSGNVIGKKNRSNVSG